MREFFISNENREKAYELLQELLASDFFMEPPVYLQVSHQTVLADLCKAIDVIKQAGASDHFTFKVTCFPEAKDNVIYYYMNGTNILPGAKQFFEKIDGILDEIISLLIINNNATTMAESTVQDALQRLMPMLYKNYTFTLKVSDPSKDFKMYTNADQQIVFRSTLEHRNTLLAELKQWTYSEYYKGKVWRDNPKIFKENPELKMPAIYPDNKECFYFPFFNATNGEKGINFGGDRDNNRIESEKRVDNFLTVMGFTLIL